MNGQATAAGGADGNPGYVDLPPKGGEKTWKAFGLEAPVPDACAPEIVGERGQRLRFTTQSELDDVIGGCRRQGMRLMKVQGGRAYGRKYGRAYKGPDGAMHLLMQEEGTARAVDKAGRWVGQEEILGGYRITVMLPVAG